MGSFRVPILNTFALLADITITDTEVAVLQVSLNSSRNENIHFLRTFFRTVSVFISILIYLLHVFVSLLSGLKL